MIEMMMGSGSAESKYMAVALNQVGGLKVYDCEDWSLVPGIPVTRCTRLDWSNDGSMLAMGGDQSDGSVRVLDTDTWSFIPGIPDAPGVVNSVRFSPDGEYLAISHVAASGGRTVLTVRRTSDWGLVYQDDIDTNQYSGLSNALEFSHDGEYLVYTRTYVAINTFTSLEVLRVSDWTPVSVPNFNPTGSVAVLRSGPGMMFVSRSAPVQGERSYVFNTEDWTRVEGLPFGGSAFRSAAFSPDGGVLFLGYEIVSQSGGSVAFDTRDFEQIPVTSLAGEEAYDMDFSRGGMFAAVSWESSAGSVSPSAGYVVAPSPGRRIGPLADFSIPTTGPGALCVRFGG